jgi:hypothetical protein
MPKMDWFTGLAILVVGASFLVAAYLLAGLAGFLN